MLLCNRSVVFISLHAHRLSAMQRHVGLGEFFCSFCQEYPLFLAKNSPPPPRIGNFHGGLIKFGYEAVNKMPPPPPPPGLDILMEDIQSLGIRLPRITAPAPKWKFGQDLGLWVVGCQQYPLPLPPRIGTSHIGLRIPSPNENLVRTWDFEF